MISKNILNNKIEIGIDIVNHEKIKNLSINEIKRFLTKKEFIHYLKLNDEIKIHYLAGRWAAKEAIFKAINIFFKINLINIEILNDENNKPYCTNIDNIYLSISHTENYSVAISLYYNS